MAVFAPRQLTLPVPNTWGGRRRGAGPKPRGLRPGVSHRIRPYHDARHPAHLTLRATRGVPNLRTARVVPALREALRLAQRETFRICHFSVQSNHIHLLVEAKSREALSRGIQGLAIRLARAINRALRRSGKVWADRYHRRDLATPREVRNALVYVLNNVKKHRPGFAGLDPCSSAAWFTPHMVTGCGVAASGIGTGGGPAGEPLNGQISQHGATKGRYGYNARSCRPASSRSSAPRPTSGA